nr:MAG TPA: hypothetical protein [Caudoviricetes sp.]
MATQQSLYHSIEAFTSFKKEKKSGKTALFYISL